MSNSTMNEQEESPWASLEAEFEEQPATERVAITTGTPNRQRTFRVAGALSLFSGYSPAVVLTVLATFMGLANVYQKFASVIGIAQAVLLAWIVSVIFRDPHRGPVFHAVLGLLAAGTVELSLAFSVWSAESSLRPAPLQQLLK